MTLDVVERTGHSLNGWSAVSVLVENIFCFLFCGRKMILLVILLFLHDNLDMTKIYPRESAEIEYKRSVTGSFLKTVSAFSNTGDGVILFG
ncbi:AlbA family DNA-binding domain-containing protein, partial [Faecalibaculum rodentium]|uniref:AlbA family DNA-binding domain-containing protein n=1 Tax=Faecalibaculum rodentium TaxID=1702221 RepID=UPI00263BBADF